MPVFRLLVGDWIGRGGNDLLAGYNFAKIVQKQRLNSLAYCLLGVFRFIGAIDLRCHFYRASDREGHTLPPADVAAVVERKHWFKVSGSAGLFKVFARWTAQMGSGTVLARHRLA